MAESLIGAAEAESLVKVLETFPLKEVGSDRWLMQHMNIQKLNNQAFLNASAKRDDFVQELLASHGKIPVLVHEMILVEVWKQKVFPIFGQLKDFNPSNSYLLYIMVHHEVTILSLLESIMFFKDSCEAADDSLVDLVDYCHRKLVVLVGRAASDEAVSRDDEHVSPTKELQSQDAASEFHISMRALPVLQYITDHTDNISVINRMLCTHNLPCLLVQLIEHHPWSRRVEGELQNYIKCNWEKTPAEDQLKITMLEGQVWLALYNLLLRKDCQTKYDFNDFNRNQLLKLQSFMTDVLMDQLPPLIHLRQFLASLAFADPAPPKHQLVLEQIPEVRSNILTENGGKWKAIAKHQVKEIFSLSATDLKQQAERLTQTYNFNMMERFFSNRCSFCGGDATRKCSRCRWSFYCDRECQAKHWPKHKLDCRRSTEPCQNSAQF